MGQHMLFFHNLAILMRNSADCSLLGLSSLVKLIVVEILHIFVEEIYFTTFAPPLMYVAGVAIFINNIFMDYDAHRTCMHIRYRQYKIKDKRFSIHSQKCWGQSRRKWKKRGGMEKMKMSVLLAILLILKCVFLWISQSCFFIDVDYFFSWIIQKCLLKKRTCIF